MPSTCWASTSSEPVRDEHGVLLAGLCRIERGAAFEHLEAVGGHEEGFRRIVQAVIGAADALDEARRSFRRAHVDDQIDVAPVDAEVECGGGDDGADAALGHRRFHLVAAGPCRESRDGARWAARPR